MDRTAYLSILLSGISKKYRHAAIVGISTEFIFGIFPKEVKEGGNKSWPEVTFVSAPLLFLFLLYFAFTLRSALLQDQKRQFSYFLVCLFKTGAFFVPS